MPASAGPCIQDHAAPTSGPEGLAIPARVGGLIKAALDALERGHRADAAELIAAAAVQDIQHEGMTLLASAAGAGVLADLYARAFGGASATQEVGEAAPEGVRPATAGSRWRVDQSSGADTSVSAPIHFATSPPLYSASPSPASPLRVLYVHPGLSPGQAATDRLLNVVERHARGGRVAPRVLLAEEFTARVPRSRVLQWPDLPSREHHAALARFKGAGTEVFITPTLGSLPDSARAAINAARAMRPDVAVFIASAACPVQAAMAFERVAPVQINQNIGSPLLVRGVDAVVYRNPARLRADRDELARRGIEGIDLPAAGTDLEAAAAARPCPRGSLGGSAGGGAVPKDAVLFVSAGNKVPERLVMGTFARELAEFLKKHPKAWWMGVGDGDFSAALEVLTRAGVRKRVVLAGAQSDIRPHLKAADVYLNEYPEGGSNTVLESMACGVPVVACGTEGGASHCAGIGAAIVGPDAVTRAGYWDRASSWYGSRAERAAAAARALARAEERFGFDALVRDYESIYAGLVERAAGAAAGAARGAAA